ncbi:MAG TPA: hypothetical protein VGQ13_02495 [Nitrososphaera sp.]|nr:hypothetical protein [Nitrososphaera sp.]
MPIGTINSFIPNSETFLTPWQNYISEVYSKCAVQTHSVLFFDPLAGNGILKALQSGIDSSDAILQKGSNEQKNLQTYSDKAVAMFNDYLEKRQRYYQKEQRWANSLFWCRRHQCQ